MAMIKEFDLYVCVKTHPKALDVPDFYYPGDIKAFETPLMSLNDHIYWTKLDLRYGVYKAEVK